MFVIQIADVTDILHSFSLYEPIVEVELLAYYQQTDSICIIVSAKSQSSKQYVIKLLSGLRIDDIIEDKRCSFSEFLRTKKLPVPQKYLSGGKYCLKESLNGIEFIITVEDYFGEDVKSITKKSSYELGKILGNVHKTAYESNYHLPFGCVSSALKSGRTSFENIWSKNCSKIFNPEEISRLKHIHNDAINYILSVWNKLPSAAVHGDLALTSNFMYHNGSYGIIDFNLSGDEPLLADLLVTWYSSRYSNSFIRNIPFENIQIIKKQFFDGYLSVRELTKIENNCFKKLSECINGIYFNRYIAEIVTQNKRNFAKMLAPEIYENYFKSDAEINIREYMRYD